MTTILVFAAACVLGFLLTVTLIGAHDIIRDLRERLDRAYTEYDALDADHQALQRDARPMRSVTDTPIGDEAQVIAFRQALDTHGDEYPWESA